MQHFGLHHWNRNSSRGWYGIRRRRGGRIADDMRVSLVGEPVASLRTRIF